MTDADLIYNACLRAERKLEAELAAMSKQDRTTDLRRHVMLATIHAIRQEIGCGMAEEALASRGPIGSAAEKP